MNPHSSARAPSTGDSRALGKLFPCWMFRKCLWSHTGAAQSGSPSSCPSTAGSVCASRALHVLPASMGWERATELLHPCTPPCFSHLSNNFHTFRPFTKPFPWITSPKDTTASCTTLRFSDFIHPCCWNAGQWLIWQVLMTAAIFQSSLTRHVYTCSPKCHLTCWLHLSHLLALKTPLSITAFQRSSY